MSILNVLKELLSSKPVLTPDNFSLRDLLIKLALEEDMQHYEHRDKRALSISVSDLVYCSNKYRLGLKYPELKIAQNYYPTLILGRILHRGIEEVIKDRFHDFVVTELPIEKSITVDIDGLTRVVRVSGRVDALMNNYVVIEIKTSRADHELPLPHHVLQLRIYMNLLDKTKGLLFYINPDRIAEYWINEPLSDEELQRLVIETLENTKHPRWPWECNYCPFNIICPHKRISNNVRR